MNEQTITYLAATLNGASIQIERIERRGLAGAMRQTAAAPTGVTFPNTPAGQRQAYAHLSKQNAALAAA